MKFQYFLFWTCISEIRNREFRLYISTYGTSVLNGTCICMQTYGILFNPLNAGVAYNRVFIFY